jgi:hypothetical protein
MDVLEGEWGEVLPFMADRAADRAGWVTLEALFDSEDVPAARSPLLDLFSGRGPAVPDLSWVPGEVKGDRVAPTSVGVRHGAGTRAAARLASAGHAVPSEWRVIQDHPKRGLVLELDEAADASPGRVLDWMTVAARLLSEVPLTGRWRVTLHER